jgi:hypothetical protein
MYNPYKFLTVIATILLFFTFSLPAFAGKQVTQDFPDTALMTYFPLKHDQAILWIKNDFYFSDQPDQAKDWHKIQPKYKNNVAPDYYDIWLGAFGPTNPVEFNNYNYTALSTISEADNELHTEIWRMNQAEPYTFTRVFSHPVVNQIESVDLFVQNATLYAFTSLGDIWKTSNGKRWRKVSTHLPTKHVYDFTVIGNTIYLLADHNIYTSSDMQEWNKLEWDQNNRPEALTSLNGDLYVLANGTAILKQTSDGQWETVLTRRGINFGDNTMTIRTIDELYSRASALYATTSVFKERGGNVYKDTYIYESFDGESFNEVFNGKSTIINSVLSKDSILFTMCLSSRCFLYRYRSV